MLNGSKSVSRFLGAAVAAVYFVANCAFAHAGETNLWKERSLQVAGLPSTFTTPAQVLNQLPTRLTPTFSSALSKQIEREIPRPHQAVLAPVLKSLSSQYGNIRKLSLPPAPTQRTVVHVQDIHLNQEAQANIGKTVEGLMADQRIDLIALEGAFTPIDLVPFRDLDNRRSVEVVGNYLLRENRISGAVHAAFLGASFAPPVVGVDDRGHYNANVKAYRSSLDKKGVYQRQLAKLAAELDQQATAQLSGNPALIGFHAQVKAYKKGDLPLGRYLSLLADGPIALSSNAEVFREAHKLETTLDFTRVESERTRLLAELLKRINKEQSTELLNTSIAYRMGNLRHSDFYDYLKGLCARNGLSLARYKAMDAYVQYVLLSDAINADKLVAEVASLEEARYAALIKTEEEKNIVRETSRLDLAAKLIEFSLTPDEWNEYEKIGNSRAGSISLASFEEFYREADARNHAITRNLLREMGARESSVAVLVTGGFHAPGIEQLLKDAGVSVITFVPKLTKIETENGSSYLSVFAQEKTPLDQLFAGERLFVSPDPGAGLANPGTVRQLDSASRTNLATNQPRVEMKHSLGRMLIDFAKDHQIALVTVVARTVDLGSLVRMSLLRLRLVVPTLFMAISLLGQEPVSPSDPSTGFVTYVERAGLEKSGFVVASDRTDGSASFEKTITNTNGTTTVFRAESSPGLVEVVVETLNAESETIESRRMKFFDGFAIVSHFKNGILRESTFGGENLFKGLFVTIPATAEGKYSIQVNVSNDEFRSNIAEFVGEDFFAEGIRDWEKTLAAGSSPAAAKSDGARVLKFNNPWFVTGAALLLAFDSGPALSMAASVGMVGYLGWLGWKSLGRAALLGAMILAGQTTTKADDPSFGFTTFVERANLQGYGFEVESDRTQGTASFSKTLANTNGTTTSFSAKASPGRVEVLEETFNAQGESIKRRSMNFFDGFAVVSYLRDGHISELTFPGEQLFKSLFLTIPITAEGKMGMHINSGNEQFMRDILEFVGPDFFAEGIRDWQKTTSSTPQPAAAAAAPAEKKAERFNTPWFITGLSVLVASEAVEALAVALPVLATGYLIYLAVKFVAARVTSASREENQVPARFSVMKSGLIDIGENLERLAQSMARAILRVRAGELTADDLAAIPEIGIIGIEGGEGLRGLSREEQIALTNRVLQILSDTRPSQAGELNYLFPVPASSAPDFDAAVANAQAVLNQPWFKDRILVLQIQPGDEDRLSRAFGTDQARVRLEQSPVPYSADISILVTALDQSTRGRDLLNNSIVVDPIGDPAALMAIPASLRDRVQVATLANLLLGRPQGMRLDLMLSVYQLVQKHA